MLYAAIKILIRSYPLIGV